MRSALLVPLVAAVALLVGGVAGADDAFRKEHELATRSLLCDCGCSPQSLHDCACGTAAHIRDTMAAEIRAGKTGRQIIDEYVAKHGEKILVAPRAAGFNLVAWLGPGLALIGGAAAMMLVLRRWRRGTAEPAPAVGVPLSAADDPYVARIEREMRESS